MAVMENIGKVDLLANAESTSSGSLDTPSVYSPPDSHGPRQEPDLQQQSSENTQPEQLQRPGATSRMLSTNLLQNIVPLVRSNSDPVINLPSDSTGARSQINAGMAAMARSNGSSSGRELKDLEELLSKLNPMAEEFVPSSVVSNRGSGNIYAHSLQHDSTSSGDSDVIGHSGIRKKSNYNQGKRRMSSRTSVAQREEVIRRTVYVSDIDQQVTEEQLAALFINCGQVVDCRVCGDPNSVLRFAFIEFTDEDGAAAALALSGTMLGFYPVRVLPSKTAIAPVNPALLPRSEVEREMCARTVYCTNIDKKVSQADVKLFFESICGEVHRLRLLGDYNHSTRIAFVEFVMAGSAIAALNCSGAVLGSLPIRVSPSKTPVRSRAPRPSSH